MIDVAANGFYHRGKVNDRVYYVIYFIIFKFSLKMVSSACLKMDQNCKIIA